MPQMMQMIRHTVNWLSWTPEPARGACAGAGADCECFLGNDEMGQESSGLGTVLLIYVGMAALFLAINQCTGQRTDQTQPKRDLAVPQRFQQVERNNTTRISSSNSTSSSSSRSLGSWAPSWLVALPALLRQRGATRSQSLYRQRLRMRLRQQKELEQQLQALRDKERLEKHDFQDAMEAADEEPKQTPNTSTILAQRQKSIYFDLPSESD